MAHEQLHNGSFYYPTNDLMDVQFQAQDKMARYNQLLPSQLEEKRKLLQGMFAEFGEGSFIEGAIYSNWGGVHVHFGKNVYANFNLTLVDDTHIYVGDYTMIGPNCTLATATHPLWPEARQKAYQKNLPVHIGKNCWLGANVVVLPGITIGDNTVVGAGSVVTKDLPENVIAVGNPCRILRKVNEKDRKDFMKEEK